jgi:hypothetical protein
MPLDWHGPWWTDEGTYDPNAERVTLPDTFDLDGEAGHDRYR